MMTLAERLDKAEEMIHKPSFRENKGLGNEVGYYIFDYPADQEMYVRERVAYISKKSENSDDDYKVVVFDLYDIVIDILNKKGYLEKCFEFEKTKGFDRVAKSISNMLRITSSDRLIVNHIKENTPDKAVIFLTGIGKCYPILRSHTVLNIAEEQAAKNAGNNETGDTDTPAVPVRPVKKKKTISIKSINNAATWQIETEEDVKKYIAELEERLIKILETGTIINIEF